MPVFFCYEKHDSYALYCKWNLSMWIQIRSSTDLNLCLIANNIVNRRFAADSCSVDAHLFVIKCIFSVDLQCLFHIYHIIVLRLKCLLGEVIIHNSAKNSPLLYSWNILVFLAKLVIQNWSGLLCKIGICCSQKSLLMVGS